MTMLTKHHLQLAKRHRTRQRDLENAAENQPAAAVGLTHILRKMAQEHECAATAHERAVEDRRAGRDSTKHAQAARSFERKIAEG